jgi:hypothetical protein
MKVELVERTALRGCLAALTRHGVTSPFHDILLLKTLLDERTMIGVSATNDRDEFMSIYNCFESSGIATCAMGGNPFLGVSGPSPGELNEYLSKTAALLRSALYFPLVYLDSPPGCHLAESTAVKWERLASPTLSGEALRSGLLERARSRIGSLADRRLRKFDKSKIDIRTTTGEVAIRHVCAVEESSWKHAAGQDLVSRGQVDLYGALAHSPNALIRVAFDGDQPVAYRFDYRAGRTVSSLKWSYAEHARRISPGFALLVRDLAACWAEEKIDMVDLHGSPDTLKAVICDSDGARERADFAWPPESDRISRLRDERLRHDRRILARFEQGTSLRGLYVK